MRLVVLAATLGACRSDPPAPPPAAGSAASPAPAGCAGTWLPDPADLAARGPSPVGARTIDVAGITAEVWYPARPGSDRGVASARYDLRTAMPPAEAAKIPDADNAWLPCECARDLPIDDAHGPYPVVIFFHGAASFRAQSVFLATHWASRGFVVIAPDLAGVGLAAALGGSSDFALGVPHAILDVIEHAPAPDPLAFARPQLGSKLAVAGHSLGNLFAAALGERPELLVHIVMAGAAGEAAPGTSTLILGGDHDQIAPTVGLREALGHRPGTRLAILHRAGHLAFTDLCGLGADRGGSLAIARAHGVAIPPILETLARDGCGSGDAPFAETAPAIRALTAGVLEERLRCDPAAAAAITAAAKRYDLELVEVP